jgi:drug/metabolite transporter (DMT)-like permease
VDERPPDEAPGERRLARPPSERYGPAGEAAAPDAAAPGEAASVDDDPRRRIVLAALLALGGAVAITLAGGLLAITAGLLVIAGALGWAIAVVLARGVEASRRRWLAPTLALLGVALGQVGLWLVARQEGGTLSLVDYLAETFGVLVPLQLAIAAVVAWWQAR